MPEADVTESEDVYTGGRGVAVDSVGVETQGADVTTISL